jgi:DNA (cytosine-5)-methyltransferase 1
MKKVIGNIIKMTSKMKMNINRELSPVDKPGSITRAQSQLLLSIFSGVDLLGKGFEKEGFAVARAGDIIFGDDIRQQHFPPFRFDGVIGGPPCQDFSKARRTPPTGYGLEMLEQFKRIVIETRCKWFLLENVPQVPNIEINGYHIQRFDLNANECLSPQNRKRHFQYGNTEGYILDIKRDISRVVNQSCVTASEGNKQNRRSWADVCELQGLPRSFDLPSFTLSEKYRAVGNGVNILVARRIAAAIRDQAEGTNARLFTDTNLCACGCGRILSGKQRSANAACRKRLQKKREGVALVNS